MNKLFARTLRNPVSRKVEFSCFWYFIGNICYHQSCRQTQIILCKSHFTPVTSIDKFADKEKIILDDILVCFWTVLSQKRPAILNSSWLDFFTMQNVWSFMVNLITSPQKDIGIKKNLLPNILQDFLLTLGLPLYGEKLSVCPHILLRYLSMFTWGWCLLEGAVLYFIAESKVFIWYFWVNHLKYFRFTSTLLVHNFRGKPSILWYANVHLECNAK